jgi:limonene 1,2-monooxygenase
MGPFHRVGENPTLAIDRDLELVQWLDSLGFDEAWVGEHHSAGWEIISSPEIFIAAAAERTRHIKLGTGVISLPYHHPFMVANWMVQLDHMTHGRVMMGVGPGALASDAYMMGIDHTAQRQRMDEALGIVLRLFTETEPITYKSDWFELREALLQLRPYQRTYMPVAVASVQSPAGVVLAGKYGAAVLTITVPRDPSPGNESELRKLWAIAEESAAEHGQEVRREDWRLVIPVHLAESRQEARAEARLGAGRYLREYSEGTNGRRPLFDGPLDKVIDFMSDAGFWIVGTPDDCIAGIKRLEEQSGGYGGLLVQTIDWAPRDKMLRSYELLARYVMPQFQGSVLSTAASNRWAFERKETLLAGRTHAIDRARQDYAASKRSL